MNEDVKIFCYIFTDSFENCNDTFPAGFTDSNCYNSHMPNCSDYERNGLCNSLWEDFGCIRDDTNITGLVKEYCKYSCRYYGVDCTGMLTTFIEPLYLHFFNGY